ncbi:MAG: HD domain-containing protein [Blautia sp.]|nr:HD domain-containing protein [Blautia sp.]
MKQLQNNRWQHGTEYETMDRDESSFLELTGTDDTVPVSLADGREEVLDKSLLYKFIHDYAKEHGMLQTMHALVFAQQKHEGQHRSGKKHIPYICHPMMVAVQAISMGFDEDSLVAACLLHDVLEDCEVLAEDLPVSEETVHIVELLTRNKTNGYTEEGREAYYNAISENKYAVILKLLDRNSNLSDMAEGFSRRKMLHYLDETERFIYPLFEKAEEYFPEKKAQILVLKYHMESIRTTVERLTEGKSIVQML